MENAQAVTDEHPAIAGSADLTDDDMAPWLVSRSGSVTHQSGDEKRRRHDSGRIHRRKPLRSGCYLLVDSAPCESRHQDSRCPENRLQPLKNRHNPITPVAGRTRAN